jgi:hypothetical protein
MTPLLLAENYGSFDSRFPGVVLRFENPKNWELFLDYAMTEKPSESEKWGKNLLKQDISETFNSIALATVYSHEIRHFHDFLLSPLGTHVFRIRFGAAINGLQILNLAVLSKKKLAVPIIRWLEMTPDERSIHCRKWGLKESEFFTPDGASLEAMQQIRKSYEALDLVLTGAGGIAQPPLDPIHILEASAIIVQAQEIWSALGEKPHNLFLNTLSSDAGAWNYGRVLRWIFGLQGLSGIGLPRLAAQRMLTWSLLGNYARDGAKARPEVRFESLMGDIILRKLRLPAESENTVDVFGNWDNHFGVTSLSQTIDEYAKMNSEPSEQIKEAAGRVLHGDALLETFTSFSKASNSLRRSFLEDPDRYLRAHDYLEDHSTWPTCHLRIEFIGFGPTEDMNKPSGVFELWRWQTLPDGRIVVQDAYLPPSCAGESFFDRKCISNAYDAFTLCDFCFARSRRDEPGLNGFGHFVLGQVGVDAREIIE